MAKKDPFWDAELKGREQFKDLFLCNTIGIAYGTLTMPYDGVLVTKQSHNAYIFEIKKRDFGFGKYPDYFLEETKANSLLKTYENNKHLSGAWYVNILDDTLLIWDVTKIDLGETTLEWCNKTTAVESEKVQKPCYHLKPSDTIWMQKI